MGFSLIFCHCGQWHKTRSTIWMLEGHHLPSCHLSCVIFTHLSAQHSPLILVLDLLHFLMYLVIRDATDRNIPGFFKSFRLLRKHVNFCLCTMFTCLFKKQRSREIHRQKYYMLIHSINACNNCDCKQLKLGVGKLIHVTHMDGRDPTIWAIIYCHINFALVGSWSQESSPTSSPGSPMLGESVIASPAS